MTARTKITRGACKRSGYYVLVLAGAAAAILPAGGCKLGPGFKTPAAPLAESWSIKDKPTLTGEPVSNTDWWKSFNDPVLESLVTQAFAQNLDLQSAAIRIVQARIGRSFSRGLLAPVVTGKASAAHVNLSQTVKPEVDVTLPKVDINLPGPLGAPQQVVTLAQKPSVSISPEMDVYSAGFDALWELDLWGGARRRIESSSAGLQAAYAGYDAIRVSLAGEVASNYVEYRVLQNRLAALNHNLGLIKGFQETASGRFAAKERSEADMRLAEGLAASVAMTIPGLEAAMHGAENRICVLLGKAPQDLKAELGGVPSMAIPSAPDGIAVGVPADLLRRRPDVRMAESLAHAQCARIGIAKASIMPSFSLVGTLGVQTSDFDKLLDRKSVNGAYGGVFNITQLLWYPLSVLRVRGEDAQFQESLLQYKQTVLNASLEVENAMNAYAASRRRRELAAEGSKAASRSAELVMDEYASGKADVSAALDALGYMTQLQDQEIAAQGDAVRNVIAIYKGLGGGWESRRGTELLPEDIRKEMKDRSDWWTFTGKGELRTDKE